jgi:hypothetical protein
MVVPRNGYRAGMPGEHSPNPEHTTEDEQDVQVPDKRPETAQPEAEGLEQEGSEGADVTERLDEDPTDVGLNRRDVPDTPENSYEARTADE